MFDDERIATYIHSLEKPNSEVLEAIEKQAVENAVPIIRKEMESFLRVMLEIKNPKEILELGTAIGYSAILMSECCDAHITTIENYDKRIPLAEANIQKARKSEQITLVEGDALEVMQTLEDEKYDFIFMDAAKAQYINYLPQTKRLMQKGAVLVCDNILQDGDLIQSKFVVERRDRTIHKRMREFLETIKYDEELETSIVPLGDGITVSVKP